MFTGMLFGVALAALPGEQALASYQRKQVYLAIEGQGDAFNRSGEARDEVLAELGRLQRLVEPTQKFGGFADTAHYVLERDLPDCRAAGSGCVSMVARVRQTGGLILDSIVSPIETIYLYQGTDGFAPFAAAALIVAVGGSSPGFGQCRLVRGFTAGARLVPVCEIGSASASLAKLSVCWSTATKAFELISSQPETRVGSSPVNIRLAQAQVLVANDPTATLDHLTVPLTFQKQVGILDVAVVGDGCAVTASPSGAGLALDVTPNSRFVEPVPTCKPLSSFAGLAMASQYGSRNDLFVAKCVQGTQGTKNDQQFAADLEGILSRAAFAPASCRFDVKPRMSCTRSFPAPFVLDSFYFAVPPELHSLSSAGGVTCSYNGNACQWRPGDGVFQCNAGQRLGSSNECSVIPDVINVGCSP